MRDYQTASRDLRIDSLEERFLQGRLSSGLNACVECCERWSGNGSAAPLQWVDAAFDRHTVAFAELEEQSARFANLLAGRRINPGDVVAGLLSRIPELLTVVLGTWRAGAVYQPLFTAFGPKSIEQRVSTREGSGAKLIVTDSVNRAKLAEVLNCPPVLEVDRKRQGPDHLASLLARQPATFAPVPLRGDDPFVLLFTSGTTGALSPARYVARTRLA